MCFILIIWHYIKLGLRKKSCYVISREYKTIFPFWFLIAAIATTTHGILKVAYPDGKQPLIGRDLSASLVVAFTESCCFIGVYCYLRVILVFLEGYSRMMTSESRLRMSQRFHLLIITAWFIPPIVIIYSLLQLISISYPLQSKELLATRLVVNGLITVLSGLILCNALSFLIKELKGVPSSTDLKIIITRLQMALYGLGGACFPFGALNIAFGSSTFLFKLSTYLVLVSYICVPTVMVALVMTVSGVSRHKSKKVIPTVSSNQIQNPIAESLRSVPSKKEPTEIHSKA
jgi:hypothetical protein